MSTAPITSSREDRHAIHVILMDHAATSKVLSQQLRSFHQDSRLRIWYRSERTLEACIRHRHTDPSSGLMEIFLEQLICCSSLYLSAANKAVISAADALRCSTAIRRIRRSSQSVGTIWWINQFSKHSVFPRPLLPTVMHNGYILIESFCNISKENPPFLSSIIRLRSNSVSW
ncbi:hypothetical protein TNCV_1237981 [Trichonephila clavipes]|nr:hypothetical protein TNCV_1237981 [Trichonephila clavipes]